MSSTGFSNEDFRALTGSRTVPKSRNVDTHSEPTITRKNRHSGGKKVKTRPKVDAEKRSSLPSGYRDRAAERRRRERESIGREADVSIPDDMAAYMGGSMDRTHVVKGLDLLLLQKTKDQMQEEIEADLERAYQNSHQVDDSDKLVADRAEEKPVDVKFRGFLARSLYDQIIGSKKQPELDQDFHRTSIDDFLTGRTLFEFEVDAFSSKDVPTTVRRSKEDCPVPPVVCSGEIPPNVVSKLEEVMNFLRSGTRKSRKLAAEKSETTSGSFSAYMPEQDAPVNPESMEEEEESDNIFSDAGDDYVCSVGPISKQIDSQSYFSPPREAIAGSPHQRPSVGQALLASISQSTRDVRQDSSPEPKGIRGLQPMEFDEYADIGADVSFGVYASDEEDGKKSEPSEPRKSSKMREAKEKSRLNKQWQKISNIIESKKKEKKGESSKDGPHGNAKRRRVDG